MNKLNECEIVKDLAIPFTEDLINTGSKEFVKKHLDICDNCREYYKDISSQISDEHIKGNAEDKIIINQFKKIHKHISILKISLMIVFILAIIICSVVYIKYQKFTSIISRAYNKVEYMKELDNYKLIVKTTYKNFEKENSYYEYIQEYYYKDGKYKIEAGDSTFFYEDNSYDKICVFHNLKTIEYHHQNIIEKEKGNIINMFSEVINYKNLTSIINSLAFSIREERYNGVDCYVIRFGNKNSYRDLWIDKNNFVTVRVINEEKNVFYREEVYSFYENIVTDEDVSTEILQSAQYEDYSIENISTDASEEISLYYNLLYSN